MVLHCSMDDERKFFNQYACHMTDGIKHRYRTFVNNPSFCVPATQLQDMLIEELSELFLRNGSSIGNFKLPQPRSGGPQNRFNRLIQDEQSYDLADLLATSTTLMKL